MSANQYHSFSLRLSPVSFMKIIQSPISQKLLVGNKIYFGLQIKVNLILKTRKKKR